MNKPITTLLYSHGKGGTAWHGSKLNALMPIALRHGINVISIDYNGCKSIEDMENHLLDTLKNNVNVPENLLIVGSSQGGYLATCAASKIQAHYAQESINYKDDEALPKRKLIGTFLVAPAFYIRPEDYPNQAISPAPGTLNTLVHGYEDEIIPYQNSVRFAEKYACKLHLMPGDHRLNAELEAIKPLFEVFIEECLAEIK